MIIGREKFKNSTKNIAKFEDKLYEFILMINLQVKWYKDTMLLDPTNNRHMEVYGNRHVLTLKSVKETDFGNYSCMADNSLGRERGSIEVSGITTS